jgi:hypothetical protein
VQLQPTKAISILMATRGRPELAFKSLKSMIDLAHNVDQIEFCVAIDNDDIKSMDYFKETVVPWFEEKDHNILVMTFDRLGYANLPKYMETLALQSRGAWFIVWNDDALMESQDWDKEIVSYTGQFKLLAFKDNHNEHPYSIFPIVPREWVVLFGTISPQQAIDAWVSQIAYIVDCFQRIEATVTHDRHDLTGNNDDSTYAEREFLEGDPENPKDAFHPDMVALKQQYVEKVVWFLKCIGQDTGRWDKVLRKEVGAMALLHENDPNQHLGVFKKIDGKMVNVGKL